MCKGVLEINSANGTVVRHFPPREKGETGDALSDALKAAREEASKREEKFKEAQQREKYKLQELDKAFMEKHRETRESDDGEKPIRDIDLD
jgi:hypothetical protein